MGLMALNFLNLPPRLQFQQVYTCLARVIPASKQPDMVTINHVLQPLISVTTMAIHLLGSPYGISSHSPFMANWPYPSPLANMATSSSYGPFMPISLLGPSWPFTSIQKP
ncbi:hypothetical protein O181_028166 [Austropuccinia psidii MF-1]|uniref:Uncharacterized protein n=1 Tax=Austropuccinia psidii MF-1 TaxID=1389203 RepID=A0A9Q3CTY0_9BASI|nr:hypothetical protein [Austropuccinia psidii MF-1]